MWEEGVVSLESCVGLLDGTGALGEGRGRAGSRASMVLWELCLWGIPLRVMPCSPQLELAWGPFSPSPCSGSAANGCFLGLVIAVQLSCEYLALPARKNGLLHHSFKLLLTFGYQ